MNACFGTYSTNDGNKEGGSWAFVACGDEEGKTVLWDVSSKEVLQVLAGHEGPVLGVDVSPSSDAIATCGMDGTVTVWKKAKAKPRKKRARRQVSTNEG